MTPGYVDPNGRIRVPTERADVTALTARIQTLSKQEKDAVRAWLSEKQIPDSRSAVTEEQVRAVDEELDRRAALAAPAPAEPNDQLF